MMSKKIKDAIDTRLDSIKISDELENRISKNSYKTRKRVKKTVAIAAAALVSVMLSVTVMAATVPSFNKLLEIVSPQMALYLRPIQLTSIDDGIKMEVIAAMNDEDTAVVYLSMQDLTGERVDDSISLLDYEIEGMWSYQPEVISYDKATKTAIIRILASGASELKKLSVNVDSFYIGNGILKTFDTNIDLVKAISKADTKIVPFNNKNGYSSCGGNSYLTDKLINNETINLLKTDQINIALPNNNFAHISNIGIVDGKLHVQLKRTSGAIFDDVNLILIDDTGNKIKPNGISFGFNQIGRHSFEYDEFVFDVNEKNLYKYKLNEELASLDGCYTEGNWYTTFNLKPVGNAAEVNCNINLDEIKINKASVSSIGVTLFGDAKEKKKTKDIEVDNINVQVKMNDNSVINLKYNSSEIKAKGGVISKYLFSEPIKFEEVKEISINGNVIVLK